MSLPRLLLTALAVLATAAPAAAQSLTSVRGLGYPMGPVDARSEIMGGLGIGLQGFGVSLTNPAAPAGVARRGVVVSLQSTDRDVALGETSGSAGATRFPLFRVVFPVRGAVLTLGYGGVLDQAFGVESSGTLDLGTGGTLPFNDVIESSGGVGQFQLGGALPVGEDVAIGVSVGALTGSQRVRLIRRFDTAGTAGFEGFSTAYGWRYSGLTAAAGATARLGNAAKVGASVTWFGTVSADSADGASADREFDLPLQVAGGGSIYIGPQLLAAVSARWSGWSAAAPEEPVEGIIGIGDVLGAVDTWEFGAGLELDNPNSRRTRSFPLRVGFQYRQLPFTFIEDQPVEWFVGGGIGMRLGTDAENPVGLVDLAIQRGARTATGSAETGDLDEQVWRVALTLSLFGN